MRDIADVAANRLIDAMAPVRGLGRGRRAWRDDLWGLIFGSAQQHRRLAQAGRQIHRLKMRRHQGNFQFQTAAHQVCAGAIVGFEIFSKDLSSARMLEFYPPCLVAKIDGSHVLGSRWRQILCKFEPRSVILGTGGAKIWAQVVPQGFRPDQNNL